MASFLNIPAEAVVRAAIKSAGLGTLAVLAAAAQAQTDYFLNLNTTLSSAPVVVNISAIPAGDFKYYLNAITVTGGETVTLSFSNRGGFNGTLTAGAYSGDAQPSGIVFEPGGTVFPQTHMSYLTLSPDGLTSSYTWVTSGNGGTGFVELAGTSGIGAGGQPVLGHLTFTAVATPVPEVDARILLGIGLCVLACLARRRSGN